MGKNNLGSKLAAMGLASVLAISGAGAVFTAIAFAPVDANVTSTAQAKLITKSGNYFGAGKYASPNDIKTGWISGGKLHLKGRIWRGTDTLSGKRYKKGTYTFRLAKNCWFGEADESFWRMSKKSFVKTHLKGAKFPALTVKVKNGKAVKVFSHA